MTKSEVEEVAKLLVRMGFEDDDLDELVHHAKSMEASDINNLGIESQLSYLLGVVPLNQVIDYLNHQRF